MKTGEAVMSQNQVGDSRAVLKGSHCQYVNLCALDTMAAKGCESGQKFVIKVNIKLF